MPRMRIAVADVETEVRSARTMLNSTLNRLENLMKERGHEMLEIDQRATGTAIEHIKQARTDLREVVLRAID